MSATGSVTPKVSSESADERQTTKDEQVGSGKHREHFRPFAPSVLSERADEWFDVRGAASRDGAYMRSRIVGTARRRSQHLQTLRQDL
jgi:predicted NodU family carbamoyl transferase